MVLSEPGSHQNHHDLDLSGLQSPLMPQEVRRHAASMCELIEGLAGLTVAKETAFLDTTEAIQQATRHVVEAARLREEHLLSDLWIQHQRGLETLSRGQNQVSDHIQAVVRLMDSADVPAMEWSLPSRTENTEIILNRLDDLEQLVMRVQAECSSVVTYTPHVTCPTLGSLRQCAVSQYKSPVIPNTLQHIQNSGPSLQSPTPERPRKDILRVSSTRRPVPTPITTEESTTDSSEQEQTVEVAKRSPVPAPRRRKIHRSLSVHARRTMPLILQHQAQSGPTTIYPQFMFKLDSIGNNPGQLKQPTDAVLLPNGNILVADYNNRRLQEFDQKGESVQLFTYPRIKPKALTITRDNFIAVVDGIDRNIKTYTRGAELVCRFGTGYFRDPCAIATTSQDHYVMIDTHLELQKSVFVYNPMTGAMTTMGFVKGNYIFSNPEDVAVTKDDHILVTDAGHHCVFLFTGKGKLVDRFGQEGGGPGQFWYPKGICVDHYNNFLVADCGNHRISLFTQNGRYLCNVIDSHHGLYFPLNICINRADVLVVVQNAEIHVFHVPRSKPLQSEYGPLSTSRSLPGALDMMAINHDSSDQANGTQGVRPQESSKSLSRPDDLMPRPRSLSVSSVRDVDLTGKALSRLSVLRAAREGNHGNQPDNPLEDGMLI